VNPLDHNPRMLARLTAFVVWALVAATAVFWGLRLVVRPLPAPAYTVAVGEAMTARGDLSRLLGATPAAASPAQAAAPELASRFKLLGVMAAKPPNATGFALIAVDAKPARAYAVGSALDGDLVLQAVSLRSASIGPEQGSTALTLEIPALPAPATGTLPAPGDPARAAAAPATAPAPAPAPAPARAAGRPVPTNPAAAAPAPPPRQLPPQPPVPGAGSRAPGLLNR